MIAGFPCLLATGLPVSKTERERESKRDPQPETKGPSFPRQLPSPPQFYCWPHPFLTIPNATPCCPGGVRAEGSPPLSPALPKEQSLATLACDCHPHASLERGWWIPHRERNRLDQVWPVGRGCSAEKGQSLVSLRKFLGVVCSSLL